MLNPSYILFNVAYFPSTGYFESETFTIVNDEPFPNRAGRTHVESCCWWGRGSSQVKGVCMYGKLNWYMGLRAKKEGRKSMFPDIDVRDSLYNMSALFISDTVQTHICNTSLLIKFCKRPQEICSGKHSTRLTWASGMMDWIENIQSELEYGENLDHIVSGDMDRTDFIRYISEKLDGGRNHEQRLSNFILILDSLAISLN